MRALPCPCNVRQVRGGMAAFLERRSALDRACHDVLSAQVRTLPGRPSIHHPVLGTPVPGDTCSGHVTECGRRKARRTAGCTSAAHDRAALIASLVPSRFAGTGPRPGAYGCTRGPAHPVGGPCPRGARPCPLHAPSLSAPTTACLPQATVEPLVLHASAAGQDAGFDNTAMPCAPFSSLARAAVAANVPQGGVAGGDVRGGRDPPAARPLRAGRAVPRGRAARPLLGCAPCRLGPPLHLARPAVAEAASSSPTAGAMPTNPPCPPGRLHPSPQARPRGCARR